LYPFSQVGSNPLWAAASPFFDPFTEPVTPFHLPVCPQRDTLTMPVCSNLSQSSRGRVKTQLRDGCGQQGSVGDLCPAGDLRDEFFRQEIYTIQIDQPNSLIVKINAADGCVFQGKPISFSLRQIENDRQ